MPEVEPQPPERQPAGLSDPDNPIRVIQFPEMFKQNPPCIWCNGPTQRTGACYTCIACGATTSC